MDQPAPPMPDMRQHQTMDAFAVAWANVDIDGLMDLFGEDPTYHTSSGSRFQGREAVRRGLIRMCRPGPAAAAAPPPMVFFGNQCLAFWTLTLPDSAAAIAGVDVITFDAQARIVSKDAYRKLA